MSESSSGPKPEPPASTTHAEKPQLPVEVFHEMERRDENQILAGMLGQFLQAFVYSIVVQGRRVTSLSYAGLKEAIRRRGNVEILEVRTEETPEEIRALVKVRDHDNHIDVLGASSAEKSKPFAYVLALNKAERNAFAKLIPAKWYAVLIDEYLQRKQGARIPGRPEETTPHPAREEWHLKVPVLKDPIVSEGVRQVPLIQGTRSVGMVNVLADSSEASIVPEKPIPADSAPIKNFLISRVLDAIVAKHPDVGYRADVDENGMLRAVLIRGKLDEAQLKDLVSASKWTFTRVMEPQTATQAHAESPNR